ncbi:MAG: hypothetical protein U0O41_08405 [Clostridia bacterium]|jgi:hypothetical protein|nr:MAG TPA: nuclease [Caudoviricetes sp.]DAY62728.1 MAG TPA: nuclease [Caudoviricetes sp.]
MEYLDITKLNKNKSCNIKIGELSPNIINLLNLDLNPQNIYLWGPRIEEHCEKHKSEYSSTSAYNEAISNIPLIIKQPDFVGVNEKNGNIQYIKKLTDVSLIGVKITSNNNGLLFRTIFPITESKLRHNIKTGVYKKIN